MSELTSYPASPPTPFLWNLSQWITRPLKLLDACSHRYGDCFTVKLTNYLPPFTFFSNPEAIEQILTANPNSFDCGRGNWLLRPTLGDQSLLLLDGDRHQRHRQLLMPPFHGERMRTYGQTICQITEDVIQDWKVGQVFTARPLMQMISLRTILQTVFGLKQEPRHHQLQEAISTFLDFSTSPLIFSTAFFPFLQRDLGAWSPAGKFLRMKQQVDDLLYAEIEDRRTEADTSRTDILSLLLAARDEEGQPLTDIELRDELMTLLVAGHETTATALSWALYWIHRDPQVRDKLMVELDSLGERPDPGAIVRLPYLSAVCSETLRINPIAFITEIRITKVPVEVMGYKFPENSYLVPCIYLTHRREDLYPEADQFQPERFLERQFSPYEYLPFGGSNRRCIGAAFALYEMKLALATILQHYELALAENRPVTPTRRGVTLAPKGGVKMRVRSKLK